MPGTSSSPWMRRYPRLGFSRARRSASWRMKRTVRGRPGRLGAGPGRVTACQQVAVPAQHRVRPNKQPEPAKYVAWEPVQQGGQERPAASEEPRPGLAQLPLQDRDLVAQCQDLHVLVPVAQRKQPQ